MGPLCLGERCLFKYEPLNHRGSQHKQVDRVFWTSDDSNVSSLTLCFIKVIVEQLLYQTCPPEGCKDFNFIRDACVSLLQKH